MQSSKGLAHSQSVALVLILCLGACQGKQDGSQEVAPADDTGTEAAEPVAQVPPGPPGSERPAETTAEPPPAHPQEPPSEAARSPQAAPSSPPPSPPAAPPPPSRPPAEPKPAEPPPPAPAAPPEPQIIEVTVPEGSILELELLTALDTSVNRAGDEIQARTLSPVHVRGEEALPRGTYVEGRVTEAQASGRVKGKAQLAFTFDQLSTRSGLKKIRTSYVAKEAASGKKKDATVIGGGAGIGALVGGIIGGKKGAAIGAAVGGAGGTSVVLATKGEEIKLPVGTEVNVRLDEPVTIQLN